MIRPRTQWAWVLSGVACAIAGCAGGTTPVAGGAQPDVDVVAAPSEDARFTTELWLQARTGAQGGNESFVTLGDAAAWKRVERTSDRELDFSRPPAISDRATAYVRTAPIPPGMGLVVEGIDVYATAAGDSNGHGLVEVRVGRGSLLRLEEDPRPLAQWFAGRTILRPGQEGELSVRLANSSAVDLRVHGRLEPLDSLAASFDEPFLPAAAPAETARAGGGAQGTHGLCLTEPTARLQLRAGAGGGNPNRIDLAGKRSMYVDEVALRPISFATLPGMHERSVAYVEGGLVPPGKVFVVTRIDYAGSAKGDSNGHGELIVAVKDVRIVAVRDQKDPIRGTWTGRLEIAAGDEHSVFAEIANSSTADVRLTGEFVDAPAAQR